MIKDTLITLVRDHNESGLILARKYNIKNIILVSNKTEENKLKDLVEIYKENNENIIVNAIYDDINNVLLSRKDLADNIMINLTLENTLENIGLRMI